MQATTGGRHPSLPVLAFAEIWLSGEQRNWQVAVSERRELAKVGHRLDAQAVTPPPIRGFFCLRAG